MAGDQSLINLVSSTDPGGRVEAHRYLAGMAGMAWGVGRGVPVGISPAFCSLCTENPLSSCLAKRQSSGSYLRR